MNGTWLTGAMIAASLTGAACATDATADRDYHSQAFEEALDSMAEQPVERDSLSPLRRGVVEVGDLPDNWKEREPVDLFLTLASCFDLAVGNNRTVLLENLSVQLAETSVDSAEAYTDLLFTADLNLDRSESPITNRFPGDTRDQEETTTTTGGVGLSQSFFTGTTVQVTHDFRRITTNSPFNAFEWSSGLGVSVSQDLLDGFGINVNRADLDIARIQLEATKSDARHSLHEVRFSVAQAYWNLVLALEDLKVLRAQLDIADKGLETERRKLAAGTRIKLDVERAEATKTRIDADIIRAEALVGARSDALLVQILPEMLYAYKELNGYRINLMPKDALADEVAAERVPNVNQQVRLALQDRQDLRAFIERQESAIVRVRQRDQQLLPTLRGTLSAGIDGAGDDYGRSWDNLAEADNRTYGAGLSLEVPIFNTSDRAAARRAELELQRSEQLVRQAETQVISEVLNAIRDLETSNQAVLTADKLRDLALAEYESEKTRRENGTATSFEVDEALSKLTEARRDFVREKINQRIASLELARATGALGG